MKIRWHMRCTRSVEAAVEAKKADGATCSALLMPRPPNLTGLLFIIIIIIIIIILLLLLLLL